MSELFLKTYDPALPLFSLHVPKCGGQSFAPILNQWFKDAVHTHYYDEIHGMLPVVHSLSPGSVVHGHFSRSKRTEVERFYPEASQFISFIRSPFDIAVSEYFYLKESSSNWLTKRDIARSLESHLERSLSSRHDPLFGFLPQRTGGQRIGEFIQSHFVFLGLFDEYQYSVDWLAELLGKPRVHVPHINKATYTEEIPDLRDAFRSVYKEEYELYDLVHDMISKRRKHGPAISDGTARRYIIHDLQQELAESKGLRERLAHVEADREARLAVIRNLEQALKASAADRAVRLEIIHALERELEESGRDRATRLDIIRNLRYELEVNSQDFTARTHRLQQALDTSEANGAVQRNAIHALEAQLACAGRELADARLQLDAGRAWMAALQSSRSWRWTRPLRWVKDLRPGA